MPLIDRGVTMLTKEDLHAAFQDISCPMEILLIIFSLPIVGLLIKKKVFSDFPNNLFYVLLLVDLLNAIVLGPLRWAEFNPFYDDVAYPSSENGCRFVVWLDTFIQFLNLFTNTAIVSAVFYTVYFKLHFSNTNGQRIFWWLVRIIPLISLLVGLLTAAGLAHNYVGWCTADSENAIIKQLMWFLCLVIQITMILPTNYLVYTEMRKKNEKVDVAISLGFYIRYVTTLFTQLIGLFPLIYVEFMGLARKSIPHFIMYCVILLLPCAMWLNLICFSFKLWPSLFPNLNGTPGCCCCPILTKLKNDEVEHRKNALNLMELRLNKGEAYKKRKARKKKADSFFDKMPFWIHLLLTLAIPFLLLCVVSVYMIIEYNTVVNRAEVIREDIILTTLISNYIHETQKERGATGVFMSGSDGYFLCEIRSQYHTTNIQKSILQLFLESEFRNVKLVTKLAFLRSLIYMLNLEDHRRDVQIPRVVKSVGVGWYSTHNMYFVGIVALVCREATLESGTSIAHMIYSNLAFFSAKEKAGVERAKGSSAFAANGWNTQNAYRTFVELVAAQETHLYFFETYVSEANSALYAGTLSDKCTIVALWMREIAMEGTVEGMTSVEGGDWFNNMTCKLGLVRSVEATVADQLKTESRNIVESTTSAMLIVVFVLAIVLIVDGLMILGLARTSDHLKRFQIGQEVKEDKSEKKRKGKNDKRTIIGDISNLIMNMSFVYQVLIPVVMCGIGLVVVSWMILRSQVKMSQLAASTWENMNLSYFISNFIHETQKERGATGVFLGSAGAKFSSQLLAQTILCTSKRKILWQYLNEEYVDYDKLQQFFAFVFWVKQAHMLELMRQRVRSRGGEGVEGYTLCSHLAQGNDACVATDGLLRDDKSGSPIGLGYYTNMNKRMVMTVSEMAYRGSSETVEARLLAYLGFMYMKEKAGNERAVGALGMGQGLWPTQNDLRKFISLVAIQGNAYLYFEQFGSDNAMELFQLMLLSKANDILKPWQQAALTNDSVVMTEVIGSQWFGNMTIKINEWRLVEELIASELNSFFDILEEETERFIFGIGIMLICLLIGTCHIGIKGIRLLLRSNAYTLYQDKMRESKKRARAKRNAQRLKDDAKKEAKKAASS